MSEDKRNFIEQTQVRAKYQYGSERTPSEIARDFAKLSLAERIDQLDRLDKEAKSGAELTIKQAARLHRYTAALKDAHDVLRRNGK